MNWRGSFYVFMDTFFALPSDLLGWVTLITADILGLFAIFGILDRAKKQQLKESQDLSREIIDSLKEKINLLEGSILGQRSELDKFRGQLIQLSAENQTMKDLLQGRDQSTLSFQTKGLETMDRVEEMFVLVQDTNKNVERLYEAIEKHLKHLEKKI